MITRREVLRRGIAGLGALACASPVPARSTERSIKPFGDAIVIAGGPRERGRRYGRRFRDEIGEFLDREIYRPFEGPPVELWENLSKDRPDMKPRAGTSHRPDVIASSFRGATQRRLGSRR